MMRFWILVLVAAACFYACDDDVVDKTEVDFGYDYFPLEIGKYIEYEVDSIIYDPQQGGTVVDSSYRLVREEITDSFIDALGNEVFTIERSERIDSSQNWELTDVYGAYNTETQSIRKEENLEFIKMIFPIRDRRDWDAIPFDERLEVEIAGETIEMFKNWESEVEDVDLPETINGLSFEEVATVTVADDQNQIEYRYGLEKYARGVGLIYRELRILDSQDTEADTVAFIDRVEEGFILEQRIIGHN